MQITKKNKPKFIYFNALKKTILFKVLSINNLEIFVPNLKIVFLLLKLMWRQQIGERKAGSLIKKTLVLIVVFKCSWRIWWRHSCVWEINVSICGVKNQHIF